MNKLKSILQKMKAHPKSVRVMLRSMVLMGWGQAKNKQWFKAIPFFVIFLLFVVTEIATSTYWYYGEDLMLYPATGDHQIYFFRDYGGFFTHGVWGFITLGQLVVFDNYRGGYIRIQDNVLPFRSADISTVLMGEGIIALVLLTLLLVVYIAQVIDAYKQAVKIEDGAEPELWPAFKKRAVQDYFSYIIIIPAALLIMFLTIVPFLYSFLIAFTNYTSKLNMGAALIEWVGFENFSAYLFQPEWLQFFGNVFLWTIIWAIMASVTVYMVGFFQAMIVESKYVKHKKVWRVIMILPWAIPGLISLMMFRNFFSDNGGLANELLVQFGQMDNFKDFLAGLGLLGQTHPGVILWYTDPLNGPLAKVIIIMVNMWLGSPYFMLLIVGVLGTIPASLYEAAEIDGATDSQKFQYITFPWVLRATVPVIITTFTYNFNNFGAIYFFTAGGPGYPIDAVPETMRVTGSTPGQTDILISWIYKIAFSNDPARYNLASAYSIIVFLIVGIFAIYNLSRVKGFWEEQ